MPHTSRPERFLDLRPESFGAALERCDLNLAEPLDQALLFLNQSLGRVELQPDVQIAHTGSIHSREPSPAQMKYLSALGSGWHMKRYARAHGGDLHIGAEHKLRI